MTKGVQIAPCNPNTGEIRTKTYVISMRDASERREEMKRQLDKSGLDWSFCDAHDAPITDLICERSSWLRSIGRPLNDRELGCYSSHYDNLTKFVSDDSADIALVFEDDAVIDIEHLANINGLSELVARYGYIRLNAQNLAKASLVYIQGRRRLLRFRKSVYGTLAYALDKKTAKHLLIHLRKVRRPIDMEIDRFWDHGVPILCLYQPVAIESSKPTQIGQRNFSVSGLNWFAWKIMNQVEKLRCIYANLLYDLGIRSV